MHARSGGTLEVMGLLLGKVINQVLIICICIQNDNVLRHTIVNLLQVDGNTMIVMDCFALPVEGTETRVNAQAQAYEYMTAYIEAAKLVAFPTLK